MNPTILRFENLSYRYPGNQLNTLENVDLKLASGQVTAILGPNGAGKTTLLRLAYGRFKPFSGQIYLLDEPLERIPRHKIGQSIALVPQREYSPFDYSLLEYVLLGRAPYLSSLQLPDSQDLHIAEQALKTVGLHHQLNRSLQAISGGEHQLVLIARALAQEPKILLLDEPTSHLDLANKKRLIDCLERLVSQQVTIMMTSHEPDVVSALADQVVLMSAGKVMFSGTLDDVWTDEYLSSAYNIPLRVIKVDGHKMVVWD